MRNGIKVRHTDTDECTYISHKQSYHTVNYHATVIIICVTHTSAKKIEYNENKDCFWAPESESASTSKCMTPTLGTRPVSSVGLATNWRLSTIDNQTHPDSSFDRQKFLYGRLSICFSSCVFHSCIFHSRIFSAPVHLVNSRKIHPVLSDTDW